MQPYLFYDIINYDEIYNQLIFINSLHVYKVCYFKNYIISFTIYIIGKSVTTDMCILKTEKEFSISLIPVLFHIPSYEEADKYLIHVSYYNNPNLLFVPYIRKFFFLLIFLF